jgi:phosphosulfolactate synthase
LTNSASDNQFAELLANVGRTRKPRVNGITVLLDTGLGSHRIDDLGHIAGPFCDRAKIAWGSALITGGLDAKLELWRSHNIEPLLGGTLFEYAYVWGKLDALLGIVRESGCAIEVSDGVVDIPRRDKLRWIEALAAHTVVFSELGGKLSAHQLDWPTCVREDLAAGARYVVVEGREIGPVGREIREDLVDTILAAADPSVLLFEALERYQQIWFIKRLGPNVNLGNIRADDLVALECFRQGLKEQTLVPTRQTFGPGRSE